MALTLARYPMDSETISTLKTVCTAGSAREGFNGESNERLEKLADLGLLVVAYAPSLVARSRTYRPTARGWEKFKQFLDKHEA